MSKKRLQDFTCSLALLVLVALPTNSSESPSSVELQMGFGQLEAYLQRHNEAKEPLEAASKTSQWLWNFGRENSLQKAAKYLMFLSKFNTCEPEAIDYIDNVMRGCPNVRPGGPQMHNSNKLDKIVEATLVHAIGQCKSYFEIWFRETESSLDAASRRLLHDWLTGEDQSTFDVSEQVADLSLRDQPGQALTLNEPELSRFFKNYIRDNHIKACKSYLSAMSAVMDRATRLGVGFSSRLSGYFDEPSIEFRNFMRRFHRCELVMELRGRFVDGSAAEAARIVLERQRQASFR